MFEKQHRYLKRFNQRYMNIHSSLINCGCEIRHSLQCSLRNVTKT